MFYATIYANLYIKPEIMCTKSKINLIGHWGVAIEINGGWRLHRDDNNGRQVRTLFAIRMLS